MCIGFGTFYAVVMNRLLPEVGWNFHLTSAHHQEFLTVHRLWYILCSCDDQLLRTPDDGQKGCPETCTVVIPIKLEFSASVGFIHKESVTMYGHTIV